MRQETRFGQGLGQVLRDALLITLACALVATAINAWFHPRGIPFIAPRSYEILVPCPEPGGPITAMASDDPRLGTKETFRIDAREAKAFALWHLPGATNVTYDYLDPTPKALMKKLARHAASSRAQRVAVYGDGDDPDSGEQLAKELSAYGIKNVFFVKRGARALRKKARP